VSDAVSRVTGPQRVSHRAGDAFGCRAGISCFDDPNTSNDAGACLLERLNALPDIRRCWARVRIQPNDHITSGCPNPYVDGLWKSDARPEKYPQWNSGILFLVVLQDCVRPVCRASVNDNDFEDWCVLSSKGIEQLFD
jgi:hypothetical protein